MISMTKRFVGNEIADGDVPADAWATAVIKVSCILVIGVVILNSVVSSCNITAGSPFYAMYNSVVGNINSGYSLAALMVLSIGAGAIMHFLGFM
jgi:hypothetical protein